VKYSRILERLFPQTSQSSPVLSALSFLLSIPNNLIPNSWTSYPFTYSVILFRKSIRNVFTHSKSLNGRPSEPERIRQAPRRLRHRRTRQARRLLDDAYQAYLQELASSRNSSNIQSGPHRNSSIHSHPTPEPIEPIPQSVDSPILELPPFPRLNTPPAEPDFPHSALTIRVRPDAPPPSTSSISPPSYFLVYSPRPTSPANSTTSSMEFIDEIHVPLPRPRYYYHYSLWTPRNINYTILLAHRPSALQVLYNRARWFRPGRNQADRLNTKSGLHNPSFLPKLPFSIQCPCPILL